MICIISIHWWIQVVHFMNLRQVFFIWSEISAGNLNSSKFDTSDEQYFLKIMEIIIKNGQSVKLRLGKLPMVIFSRWKLNDQVEKSKTTRINNSSKSNKVHSLRS